MVHRFSASDILDSLDITIEEVIVHYGEDAILEMIGSDEAMAYWGLRPDDE